MTQQEATRAGTRRLAIVRIIVLAFGLLITARVVQVQVLEHDKWLARGNSQWSRDVTIEPERGNIYDRHGRPLAVSVTTTTIGVAKKLMDDDPRLLADLAQVLERPEASIRQAIAASSSRHVVLAKEVVLKSEQRARLRRWSAITMDDFCKRYYPTDGMAASLVGFYRQDPTEVRSTGLEAGLEKYLAGKPGQAREIQSARAGEKLGRIIVKQPVHGRDLMLTLDADVQQICEQSLREAVATTNAVGGSVLVLDPANGDVLGAASYPMLDSRAEKQADAAVWNNRNFTTQFEPGSLFKVFSGAALLHSGAIDTTTVIDCDNNSGSPYGISNDKNHNYGRLRFAGALAVSSNVYFAKAAMKLPGEKFYRELSSLGFGERTKFPYQAQPRGSLRKADKWNGADQPCIAIGQGVSATAIQLGMALCAVANGGQLYAPRCVKEIRSRDGGAIEEVQPASIRQVMAPPLAETLRGAMARVVHEGTGKLTELDWIASGGKTGTAQKSRDGRGYTEGAYMASFGGMAPINNPRLVILAVLDEPDRAHHYASQSAVPLYRDVLEEIRRCTDLLSDVPGGRTGVVARRDTLQMVEVPDVLYLRGAHADQRLASAGLRCRGAGADGVVVGQLPAAGSRCQPGATVTVTIAGRGAVTPAGLAPDQCPDFTGKSNREVRALAAALNLPVIINGVGYASTQDIAAGGPRPSGPVTVTMEPTWN